ncbi:MAG: DUF2281 domain-containing protein [Caldilineaceae bacterium]
MTIEQAVLQHLTTLPVEQKQEVLDFVEFLQTKRKMKQPRRNPIGLFADLQIQITAQDIAEARQEMWGNFPKDITL